MPEELSTHVGLATLALLCYRPVLNFPKTFEENRFGYELSPVFFSGLKPLLFMNRNVCASFRAIY
jgi:hypothetical protein